MSTMSNKTLQEKHSGELFGHPKGLFILFLTELWERYSYYGMRALLVLFLTASVTSDNPGYGWTKDSAFALYGWYTMLVYVASIPGGIFADKLLGQKKAVLIGGLLLCAGHGILAVNAQWAFFTGLALIIAGVGFLKPNISTMVGGLYKKGDERRDLGFYIFYIGINLGAFLVGFTIGPLGEKVNWHYGFGMAGIGMFIGQIIYLWGMKYLKHVGNAPEKKVETTETKANKGPSMVSKLISNPLALLITLAIVANGLYILLAPNYFGLQMPVYDQVGYGLLSIAIGLFIGFAMVVYQELTPKEKDQVKVIFLSFGIVIVFWGAFEQAGGLMNVYTAEKTDRVVSTYILDIIFAVAVAFIFIKALLKRRKKDESALYWFLGGIVTTVLLGALRLFVITGETYEVAATTFQSANSFFIFTLATLIGSFWYSRKMKGKEASSLFKMAVGVIIMGWGFFFMSGAYVQFENDGASGMYWILAAYLFHTIGELCLSPVSLSFITKLAPAKYVSIMMGVYFAATGIGNKLAGMLGEWSQSVGEFEIFTGIAVFCTIFGLLVVALLKPLKRLTHGAEDLQPTPQKAKEGELTQQELA